jgi:SnoaL-like domain
MPAGQKPDMESGRPNDVNRERGRRLDELDEHAVYDFLAVQLARLSAEEEYELRHEDYVMEMPQSGERIRGRDNMRAFQEAYPNPPTVQLRRVLVRDGLWVVEATSDYSGRIYQVVLIVELRDGRIFRETRYYADPFEAPAWRAPWVERFTA